MRDRWSRRAVLGAGLAAAAGLAGCGTPPRTTRVAPTATPSPAPTATPTPILRPTTLAITGDIMLARSVGTRMVAAGADGLFPFDKTAAFLRGYDLTVGNLECVVSRLGTAIPGKPFTFRADPLGFARLQAAGFDLVSVANNHSGDYGPVAFADMLGQLPTYGITPVGGGATYSAAHTPVIVERYGTRFALVAACDVYPDTFAATATQAGDAWLDSAKLRADITAARAAADFVIAFVHWGIEYVLQFNSQQQALAHEAIDLGADLVVGAHPHVIQPNEIYRGKPIIYSLGNFIFDLMYGDSAQGNILTLTVQGNRLLDWKLVPILIDTTTGAPFLA